MSAEAQTTPVSGFVDLNLYPYTEVATDNAVTVNAGVTFGTGWSYFSLSNIGHAPAQGLVNLDAWLTEQNLRWKPVAGVPLEATTQLLARAGPANEVLRLGLRLNATAVPGLDALSSTLGLSYWLNGHLVQFDHQPDRQWQLEHVLRWVPPVTGLNDRLYVAAFGDQNFGVGPDAVWVAEAQVGVRISGGLHAVVEQRYNGFRVGDESSYGIGFQYLVRFAR